MMTALKKHRKTISDEYVEGSITRIKLENFLTYDAVEFNPGPYLNVIIGPNGTGKSSIVCAIALGLAAKTSVLGRAKEVQDFVKHGHTKAVIELELFNKSGQNWIIKREIHRKETKDSCSKWSVNNRPASMKSVEEMVGRLNIQVGNLCQFLPQDRVADFAKMNQQELLENTEKAVGGQDMFDNHQKLKTARERGRQLQLNHSLSTEHLEQELGKNSRLEQDVKNFKERQKYLENIRTLQMKKPWVEYEDKRKQYITEKENKDKLEKELKDANQVSTPLRKQVDQAKKQVTECDQKKKKKDEDIRSQAKITANKSKVIEELTEQLDDCGQELENKRKEEEKRKKKLNELKEHVKSLEEEKSNIDVQDVQPEIDRVSGEMRNLNRDLSHTVQACESARGQQAITSREITGIQTELRRLQDVSNQRLDLLRRRNKDAYSAVIWLRNNQDKFKHTVHEPIMTVLNVGNTAHAKYIETHIPFKDMYAFVCEDKQDLETFMEELRDRQDLRVNAVEMPARSSVQFKPNKPIEEYKRYGFYTYMREMFTCPEAVMRYLCQQYAVHSVPVGNKHTKDNVENVIRNNPELRLFYTENHRYSVKISKYSGDTSTSSSEVRSMSVLTMAVDSMAERQLNTDLQMKQAELEEVDKEYSKLQRQRQDQERQMNTFRNKKKELQDRRNEERNLQNKINMKQDSIQRLEKDGFDLEKEEAEAKTKMKSITIKKIKLLREMKDNIKKCVTLSKEKVMLSIQHTDSMRTATKLEAQFRDESQNLQQIEKECADAKERMKRTKELARRLLETAKKATNTKSNDELSEELKNAFMACPNTVEEIDAYIHDLQARADCTMQTDESVIEDYQRRKLEIGRLEKLCDQQKEELDGHQDEIDRTKARWFEPLKELLSKINEQFGRFFSQLKCAGEVDLNVPENPEDYEKYGVKIRVKFRDNESLRELTSHYQSGGEKSVATVLYMMSLQELTQCPFRCVDEINQGMDPTNERKVFELVVKTACREGTSQYFLLTPKLLPDLAYGERITTLCIFNGPYMIHHKDWNIRKFYKRRAKLEDD